MHTSSQHFSGAPFLHIPPRTLLLDLPSLIQPVYSFKEIKHLQNVSVPQKLGNTNQTLEGKPEKSDATRCQSMLQLIARCILASHLGPSA